MLYLLQSVHSSNEESDEHTVDEGLVGCREAREPDENANISEPL